MNSNTSATASNSIGLTGGNKTSSNSSPFVPPPTAVKSSTSGISPTQALTNIVSQVVATTASATTVSSTTASGTIYFDNGTCKCAGAS